MWYTYILYSAADKKFYIGFTHNLKRRVVEHANGKVRSTSEREGMRLVFYEAFTSEVDARRRERYLKTSKGRNSLKQILRETLMV